MPTKLVRTGRVLGYRPTRQQLVEVLELAQRGIDDDAKASLEYWQGNKQIYSKEEKDKVSQGNVDQLIKDAGNPPALNNLHFSASQAYPARSVEVEVGRGDWTYYYIESDDPTWAHGRYHEITEKLLADRSLYAKGHAPAPEVHKEGSDVWRTAPWELATDWRTRAINYMPNVLSIIMWSFLVAEAVTLLGALVYYYNEDVKSVAARNDHHNASLIFAWYGHRSTFLVLANLGYIIVVTIFDKWLKALLTSKVLLQGHEGTLFHQLTFRTNKSDAVQLAEFYVAFSALLVSIVALFLQ